MDNPTARFGDLSLVVSISGHRDLFPEDFAGIQAEIVSVLTTLRHKYPATPLLLLSGLAEGADRIAVRAAQAASVPYIAVLPMPEQFYRQDFQSESSDAEFEELRRGALRTIALPVAENTTAEAIQSYGPARDRQYELLAEFLVKYSQILIAVWDGQRLEKTGGTSEVVAMKLREKVSGRLARSRMNGSGAGPVYAISARRVSSGPEHAPSVKLHVSYPEGTSARDYDLSYELQDRFNADVAHAGAYFSEAKKTSRRYLFEDEEAIGLSSAMEWAAEVYSRADALAIHFANASLALWKVVFGLLGAAGIALTWLHTLDGGKPALFAYYGCLAAAAAIAFYEVRAKRRARHEDYRALAEALRVQFFWMAAGLPDLAADQYLRKQVGEMAWIRDAMSECGLFDGVLDRSHPITNWSLRLELAQQWVDGQAGYFSRTARKHEKKKRLVSAFAWIAAAVGLLVLLLGLIPEAKESEAWIHAVAAVAMWFAALAWNYIERRGYAQEARQYARMYDLFQAASGDLKEFRRIKDYKAAEQTIRELGCEALAENGDWLAMHRDRELSPNLGAG